MRVTQSLLTIFFLGLSHSLTHTWPVVCASTLQKKHGHHAVKQVIFFIGAAATPWVILAALFGYLGYVLLPETWEIGFHFLFGALMITLGVYTLFAHRAPHLHLQAQIDHTHECPSILRPRDIILSGLVIGLGPCPPVLLLYGYAAQSHRLFSGMLYGLWFTLANLATLLLLSFLFSGIIRSLTRTTQRNFAPLFSFLSGLILIFFGLYQISKPLIERQF